VKDVFTEAKRKKWIGIRKESSVKEKARKFS
jgi:hypothetical protein